MPHLSTALLLSGECAVRHDVNRVKTALLAAGRLSFVDTKVGVLARPTARLVWTTDETYVRQDPTLSFSIVPHDTLASDRGSAADRGETV